MGVGSSVSFAGLRALIKVVAVKIAGRPPDPSVTARPVVHTGRGASVSWAEGQIGGPVRVRSVGGGLTYQAKNYGTAPALNLSIRASRKGPIVSLGELPPGGMKVVADVPVQDGTRFWLEWIEVDGRKQRLRRVKPIPLA